VVLNNNIKSILRILFFFTLVLSFSCEERGWLVNCQDCLATEPLVGHLDIKISTDKNIATNFYFEIEMSIYEGNLEDGVLLASFDFGRSNYEVPLNKKYTVVAKYVIGATTYIAVDSATPRVKYEEELCKNPCYWVYDRVLDVRLKYYKKE